MCCHHDKCQLDWLNFILKKMEKNILKTVQYNIGESDQLKYTLQRTLYQHKPKPANSNEGRPHPPI